LIIQEELHIDSLGWIPLKRTTGAITALNVRAERERKENREG
jgi:hypothetical protein